MTITVGGGDTDEVLGEALGPAYAEAIAEAIPGGGVAELSNGLYDIYYAPGLTAQPSSLGWAIRLCESEMKLRKRVGDLFSNVERLAELYK